MSSSLSPPPSYELSDSGITANLDHDMCRFSATFPSQISCQTKTQDNFADRMRLLYGEAPGVAPYEYTGELVYPLTGLKCRRVSLPCKYRQVHPVYTSGTKAQPRATHPHSTVLFSI